MPALVLLRHGQSAWNAQNLFTGRRDPGLTERGRRGSAGGGDRTPGRRSRPAAVFASTLVRAHTTAEIISDELGLGPVQLEPAFVERDYGALTGQDKSGLQDRYDAETLRRWRRSWDAAPPGGESLAEVSARVLPPFEARVRPALARGDALLVAHNNVLRALLKAVEGLSEVQIEAVELETATPVVYDFAPLSPMPPPHPPAPLAPRRPSASCRARRFEC